MNKKSNLNLLYVIGMAAVVVGSFLPIMVLDWGIYGKTNINLLSSIRSLSYITGWYILIMVLAAVAGIVVDFVGVKRAKLIEIAALIVSIVCGILFLVDEEVFEYFSFSLLGVGFYIILAGWIIAAIGAAIRK